MRLKIVSFLFLLGTFLFLWTPITLGTNDNINKCASYENLFEQISCYASAAKKINDLAPCDQAVHEGVRYQCYAIFAEHSASPAVCQKIPSKTQEHRSLIDVCLSDVAQKANDPNICETIITSGLRDSCYLKLAKKSGKHALCEKIRDDGLKGVCNGKSVIVD